jgi:hypothetical protein
MGLALGVLFLWLGAALLWVASHGTEASSPWQVFQQITSGLKNA